MVSCWSRGSADSETAMVQFYGRSTTAINRTFGQSAREVHRCPGALFTAMVALQFGWPEPASAGQLLVGAAKVSITPPAGIFPYLPSSRPGLNVSAGERAFTGVHDPVYARALVLGDGNQRAALVTLEVTALPDATGLRRAMARATGIGESSIMVAATHTHSVPLLSSRQSRLSHTRYS
jgi:hypothetical protein